MLVGIDVVEHEPGRRIGAELGFDLRAHLRPDRWARAYLEPEPRQVQSHAPIGVDEIGHLFGRQRRCAVDEDEMQSDAQARKTARALDRVFCRGRGHHQARCGENTFPVRQLDPVVDLGREPEVIGGDDEALQSATSRSRRNRKNSSPSRSRRFIISGLRTISPTIEAILGARK